MIAPPPLPQPSVCAASILAIREQARDGRLSRGTIISLAATAIAQQCRGTFVHPPPLPVQKQATAVRPPPPPLHEQAREGPTMLRHHRPPHRRLIGTPASEGLPTMARHCKLPRRRLDITPVSVGRPTMPRHHRPPHLQLVIARASEERPTMPRHCPRCCLHHRAAIVGSLAVVPWPPPRGTSPATPPWRRTATAPTRPAAPPSPGGRRRHTALPRPQSPHSPRPRLRSIP